MIELPTTKREIRGIEISKRLTKALKEKGERQKEVDIAQENLYQAENLVQKIDAELEQNGIR